MLRAMSTRLYVIPASHPSMAARLMLEAKDIDYKRTDLMPVVSKGAVRAFGFPGNTVPALKMDGEKVQGTGKIARFLDAKIPEPQLVPTDPKKLAKIEEIEAFGDVELQGIARRTVWNALRRDKAPLRSYSEGAKLGIPIGVAVATAGPVIWGAAKVHDADESTSGPTWRRCPRARQGRQGDQGPRDRPQAAEHRRLPGGAEPGAADDARRHPPGDRGPPGGQAGEEARPRLPGSHAAGAPARVPRTALVLERRPTSFLDLLLSRGQRREAVGETLPSGGSAPDRARAAGQGRSGGCGPPGCGSVSRSVASSISPSSSRSTSSGRGPWRGPSVLPRWISIALQTSRRALGSSSVRIRMQALRKSGCSVISPTGSVSYVDETASTATAWLGSSSIAARRCPDGHRRSSRDRDTGELRRARLRPPRRRRAGSRG